MADGKALTLRMSDDEHTALRLYAFVTKTSMNDVVLKAIRDFLTAHEDETFEGALDRFRTEYRVALDKLADL